MGVKEDLILKHLKTVNSASMNELLENVPFIHHKNSSKRMADILGNMIRDNLIVRINKSSYKIKTDKDIIQENSLF